jgi:stalled ribosome rescue protein Dom34
MPSSRPYRRGYAVALLVGLKENYAAIWKVFSNVVKPEKTIDFTKTKGDSKTLYNFNEAIVNAIRPTIKEGVKSIVVATPPKTDYSQTFLRHLKNHHAWLTQGPEKATFAEMSGSATTLHEVTLLTRTLEFRQIIGDTTTQETENLVELIEKALNAPSIEPLILYSLEEIEDKVLSSWIPGKPKPDYIMITDAYLSASRQKNRLQRLMQIAQNRGIKSRIVKADSLAGKRLSQLGGIVCILKPT